MLINRIKRIQKHFNLSPDGVIGPATLSAIEIAVFGKEEPTSKKGLYSLTLSRKGFDQLVNHEISSLRYYRLRLQKPVWPGGASGVTIGIGYDLGYHRDYQIRRDWEPYVTDKQLKQLMNLAGKRANAAKTQLAKVKDIRIPYEAAATVFSESTLPRYAKDALKTYKGLEKLLPDAQAGILSLVYNRGTRLSGSKRKEMKAIQSLVKNQDYDEISAQILSMKRLWINTNLRGLLKRRDDEAKLIRKARHQYDWKELVRI
jgi:GH24 family phage-related lysozyme (muramidase)